MEKPSYKLVGAPCGHHGQYTFYKAIRFTGAQERIVAIGDFFFVKIWQDSELVSIGELQLLWTDRVSEQTLVSLRLYFLPENTPDGRGLHGEDEVLAINDKVVVRAEDLVSWVWSGAGWRWGLRAVWRGACAPPAEPRTDPLHQAKLDFSDVDQEKSAMAADTGSPGVVVFSYPRYCRYRALLSRLEGVQADWLRDSLVCALGGYAAPTTNTRILYCKDTFEYPELEGHEFVCNHLAPRLKGRPRGRRRRAPSRDRDHSPSSRSSDSDATPQRRVEAEEEDAPTPRRLSLRNGADKPRPHSGDEGDGGAGGGARGEDAAFLAQLRSYYARTNRSHVLRGLPDMSLRALYSSVVSRGGYEAVCRRKLWRALHADQPARTRRLYERYLLPFENHERRSGGKLLRANGLRTVVATIDVTDSPLRDAPPATPAAGDAGGDGGVGGDSKDELGDKRLRTPPPETVARVNEAAADCGAAETTSKDELDITSKPAEELNREFLDSLPKEPVKIAVKPVEQLIDPRIDKSSILKIFEENSTLVSALAAKHRVADEMGTAGRLGGGEAAGAALSGLCSLGDKYAVNGHAAPAPDAKTRPGRSSLRAVRVKPARAPLAAAPPRTPPAPPAEPPLTNFGIHRPPPAAHEDDDIVEVPYKPKTPEIIDLDEYPESPQSVKKKKLDILKERGLEVTAVPPAWAPLPPVAPLLAPGPLVLTPAVQHQIMSQQAQILQMYNIIPPVYPNGVQPPKVIQGTGIFGTSGPEKTVYGNPKDPFMPPPHILHGTPVKPQRIQAPATPPQDILDLTCKTSPGPKPAVEIVRVPSAPSPSKTLSTPQNLSKNYTLLDGKAVVGSNLEITLVNPKAAPQPPKRAAQKRSSNGKFISNKTPTPPKEPPKHPSPAKKNPIVVPSFQAEHRDDASPASSTGSGNSQGLNSGMFKNQNLAQLVDMQKSVSMSNMGQFIDPVYMSALYSSLGQMDQRQLAMYRELVASQFRGYSGLLNIGTPTTKN